MSKTRIPPEQRARIAEISGYRCGYCLTQEIVIGMPLVIEHIIPEAKIQQHTWVAFEQLGT